MTEPEPQPIPSDDEPLVDWEDFEQATDLIVADQRPKRQAAAEPVNSRHVRRRSID